MTAAFIYLGNPCMADCFFHTARDGFPFALGSITAVPLASLPLSCCSVTKFCTFTATFPSSGWKFILFFSLTDLPGDIKDMQKLALQL